MRRRRVLVLGGAGRMGRRLARFFRRKGDDVSVSDPSGAPPGFRRAEAAEAAVADVVVVATPLSATPAALRAVLDAAPRGLVFDIASVKTPILRDLEAARSRGLSVASVHPMFGPTVPTFAGRDLIVCDVGDARDARRARNLFAGAGLAIRTMPIREHDAWVARTMGLAHVLGLVAASALARSGVDLGSLDGVASTSFRRLLDLALPLLEQDPALTHAIQRENPEAREAFEALVEELGAWREPLFGDDPAPVAGRVAALRRALRPEAGAARKRRRAT